MNPEMFSSRKMITLFQKVAHLGADHLASASLILDSAYTCSLYKEEGRDVRCRLIVLKEVDYDEFDLLPLGTPVTLDVPTLRGLAFATTDNHSAFVVECRGELPQIVGFGRWKAIYEYIAAMGQKSRPFYEVTTLAPGVLELHAAGATVRFERDTYKVPDIWAAASAAIHAKSVKHLVERAAFPGSAGWIGYSMGRGAGITDPKKFRLHHESLVIEGSTPARIALTEYLCEIIERIRQIHSGGALLILAGAEIPVIDFVSSGHAIRRIDKRYRGELWNAGALNTFDWMLHVQMAHLEKMVISSNELSPHKWIRDKGLDGLRQAAEQQKVDAVRVSQLTAIDGGLVMNGLLSPIMFGAKFLAVDPSVLPMKVRQSIAGRGMRHRSMAATVASVPESTGVVISQDGDVTIFTNRRGSIRCHTEHRVHHPKSGNPKVPRAGELLVKIMVDLEERRFRSENSSD